MKDQSELFKQTTLKPKCKICDSFVDKYDCYCAFCGARQ